MSVVRQQWAMRVVAAGVKQETSPLDYHGAHPRRLALYDPGAGPDPTHNSYFDTPELVAFLDYSPEGDGTFIHYMSVRGDHRGQGLARKLTQHLYDHTSGAVDWGEIWEPEAWALYQSFKDRYPDRHHRGKNYAR